MIESIYRSVENIYSNFITFDHKIIYLVIFKGTSFLSFKDQLRVLEAIGTNHIKLIMWD